MISSTLYKINCVCIKDALPWHFTHKIFFFFLVFLFLMSMWGYLCMLKFFKALFGLWLKMVGFVVVMMQILSHFLCGSKLASLFWIFMSSFFLNFGYSVLFFMIQPFPVFHPTNFFWMGASVGSGMGDSSNAKFTLENPIILMPGDNTIDLLSMTVGLKVRSIYASFFFKHFSFKTNVGHLIFSTYLHTMGPCFTCYPLLCYPNFVSLSTNKFQQYNWNE